jgi:antirestriction protein ArdC
MPDRFRFTGTTTSSTSESWYSTLLHELTHWSGAENRMARTFGERFGDDAYAMEEMVAELENPCRFASPSNGRNHI